MGCAVLGCDVLGCESLKALGEGEAERAVACAEPGAPRRSDPPAAQGLSPLVPPLAFCERGRLVRPPVRPPVRDARASRPPVRRWALNRPHAVAREAAAAIIPAPLVRLRESVPRSSIGC